MSVRLRTSLYAGLSSAKDTVMVLLRRLQHKTTKYNMKDEITKKNKSKSQELINPIIPLEYPEKEDLNPNNYIDHTCHNTTADSISAK